MPFRAVRLVAVAAPLLFAFTLCAQDTRTVTEPHIPAACITLKARIAAVHGVIPASDEQSLDTARIQNAIDNCTPRKAVVLRNDGAKNVFLIGPIQLRSNVTLVVAANTALVASRNPRLFDVAPGSCGILASRGGPGCKPLITADKVENSGIMGLGSIDGRGGATLLKQNVTWWQLAHAAKVKDESQHVFRLVIVMHAHDFTLYNITLRNSPATHVGVVDTDGFTAWGVKIMTPGTARNTDGIDPHSSRNITIEHCFIHSGDDNVAVGSSHGVPSSNISVLHNHFYTGHGMSIGSPTSGGVNHVLVDDLTIDGAQNGIRIKSDPSRGGFVHDITYRNVCIRNVTNPLMFTPHYTTHPGNLLPIYRDITLDNVHILTPGTYTFMGLDADHKLEITLNNVFAGGLQQSRMIDKDATITVGKQRGNLEPSGDDVSIQQTPNSAPGTPLACSARFVPFPPDTTAPAMAVKIPPVDPTYYVAADGSGDYYSIQQAINAIPPAGHATISVAPGIYREVLTIGKPDIQLRSANPDPSKTVIVNNRSAGANGGTLHSATVNVTADNFFAENITFENDFNRTHPQLYEGSQALALLVTGDRAVFHNVRVLGNQDTLYLGSRNCHPDGQNCKVARQFFSDSYIAGNVDFIFGDAKAAFDRCTIYSTPHSEGFITAQSKHYPSEDSGFVIDNSKLIAAPGLTGKIYLGRPWRPYATVIYLNTEMGDQINPAGWREWHPGETHSLDTAFFAEYNSSGPGASTGAHPGEREPHAHILNAQQAKKYAPATWLRGSDNWNPYLLPKPLTVY
ncbi:MAG TPA: pectinesterase family protein [Terracidiphilus sp.]|nr:pectinesterase family protein [Terracidiphilus sp.]